MMEKNNNPTTCTGWVERGHLVIHGCNLELQSMIAKLFPHSLMQLCFIVWLKTVHTFHYLSPFKQKIDSNRAQVEVL